MTTRRFGSYHPVSIALRALTVGAVCSALGACSSNGDDDDAGRSAIDSQDLVADVNPGLASSLPEDSYLPSAFTTINGTLFYACSDASRNGQLCASDGTAAGTGVRVVFNNNTSDGVVDPVASATSSRLFFVGRDGLDVPYSMGSSDGTGPGTTLTAPLSSLSQPLWLDGVLPRVAAPSVLGNVAYFFGFDATHGHELWRSDGSSSGTSMVQDLIPGVADVVTGFALLSRGRDPRPVVAGSSVYFPTERGIAKIDTASGSSGQATILSGLNTWLQFRPGWLHTVAGGAVYFFASKDGAPNEMGVYRSDATGVQFIGAATNALTAIAVVGAKVFWIDGDALWMNDGTAGTTKLASIPGNDFGRGMAVLGSSVVFLVDEPYPATAGTIWKSDGTPAGTTPVKTFQGTSFRYSTTPLEAGVVGNVLYFPVDDGVHGPELWKSDLTEAGTLLVKDIKLDDARHAAGPDNLASVGSLLYFSADDGVHGVELWSTDGTEAGTRMRGDLMPGAGSSSPGPIVSMGGKLYFAASEFHVGRELWSLTP